MIPRSIRVTSSAPRRPSAALAVVPLALAALAACATTPPAATPPGASANRAPAAAARAPLGAGRAAEIERAHTREAYDAWRARRAAEVAPATVSHRVDEIFTCLNCENLIVTERIEDGATCRQGPWVLDSWRDDGQPLHFDARLIAHDCCDGACPDRTPTAWMLVLDRALATLDHGAMRALVSPTTPIQLAAGFRGEDDEGGLLEARVARDGPMDEVFTTIQRVQLFHDDLQCPAEFDAAGLAVCAVFGGGFGASYHWQRTGAEVHLIEVSQSSH